MCSLGKVEHLGTVAPRRWLSYTASTHVVSCFGSGRATLTDTTLGACINTNANGHHVLGAWQPCRAGRMRPGPAGTSLCDLPVRFGRLCSALVAFSSIGRQPMKMLVWYACGHLFPCHALQITASRLPRGPDQSSRTYDPAESVLHSYLMRCFGLREIIVTS